MILPKALVFFDLDGTLLNDRSEVDREVASALEKLKENGGIPFIATGRSPLEIQHVLDTTPIESFITLNGQYIMYEGKEIYRSQMPKETLIRLKKTADELNLAVSFYTSDKIRVTHTSKEVDKAYDFIHTKTPLVDAKIHLNEEILMALILTTDVSVDDQLREAFPELSFYRNTPYSIDVITKGNSKATGIQELVRLMQFDAIPIYAFGDGPNDLEMVTHADHGVAMENGTDILKNAADYITSSHIEGGIVEGLEFYDLIK
ncbi:MAG: Cof-type HAD-IIB family hydrolase [Carnobacterium alterfunditum]